MKRLILPMLACCLTFAFIVAVPACATVPVRFPDHSERSASVWACHRSEAGAIECIDYRRFDAALHRELPREEEPDIYLKPGQPIPRPQTDSM